MRPHSVDANAINCFQRERKQERPGDAHKAIEKIFEKDCIALDEGGLCLQEWEECAGGTFPINIRDWAADQMIYGRIRNYELCTNHCRKELLAVGLPKKDHKWVRLAIGSGGNLIVTDDIDFFDPTKKNSSSAVKQKIKNSGQGPCSTMLRKKYRIEVKQVRDL